MWRIAIILICSIGFNNPILSQSLLKANGPGETYELINSVLAPGFNVVEVPDCNHEDFGRHIDEIMDSELNTIVFRFHIHTSPDNDRCITFDRQRTEIKTYDKSPDSLKAIVDERVEYSWKFKLDIGFQASTSFTHLHQIKAVGGTEDSMPLITLTARKGSPDQLELRYAESLTQVTLKQTDLSPFKGQWLEVKETILFGEVDTGEYEVTISKVSDGSILFNYSNTDIRMWKTNAHFMRPKWGIYRSLNNSVNLRDETVLFNDFRIEEIEEPEEPEEPVLSVIGSLGPGTSLVWPNPFTHTLFFDDQLLGKYTTVYIFDSSGKLVHEQIISSKSLDISLLKAGQYYLSFGGTLIPAKTIKLTKGL